MTYDVHDSFGQLIADTHHWLVLYKAENRDQNGDVVHFYRMLSLSEAADPWHYNARTTEMFNYVDLHDSDNDLTQVAPTSVITKESGSVTVSVGVSVGPVTASVGQQVSASGGRISPVGEYLHYGKAGGFAVQFKGDNPGSTSLPGVIDYRGWGYDHHWKTRVKGVTL